MAPTSTARSVSRRARTKADTARKSSRGPWPVRRFFYWVVTRNPYLLRERFSSVMVTAVAVGSVEVVGGLLISYHFDTAAGATMSGLAVAVFFIVLALSRTWRALRVGVG